jgi:prolycopene isomerase
MGLKDISLEELRPVEGYHWSSWDAEHVTTNAFKVFLPTAFDPGLAPPGGQILIVQKVSQLDYDATLDWPAHKKEIEEDILRKLEQLVPGLARRTAVRLSASAQTSCRYTLNHHGAMLGWEMSPDQLGERRPPIRGPFENLYFVGHWVQPGGGITPVMVSAMRAAEEIIGQTRADAGVVSALAGQQLHGLHNPDEMRN